MRTIRLGVLVPSSNTALEPLTTAIVSSIQSPDLNISVHFSRFRVTTIDLTSEACAQFELSPILIAAQLLADAQVDVIGWSGTSAGWLGFDHDEGLCAVIEAETGIRATTSVLALNSILRSLGIISFGLVTPYKKELNDLIRTRYSAIGVDINDKWERHLGITDNHDISQVTEAMLDSMVMDVASHGAHVISTFCTNLTAARRVEHWERTLSIVVLDTVLTVIWGMLKIVAVVSGPFFQRAEQVLADLGFGPSISFSGCPRQISDILAGHAAGEGMGICVPRGLRVTARLL